MRTKLIFILCAVCHTCAGYYISSCNVQGELEMKETVPLTLTCSGITDDYMLWDFTPPGGDRIQIASCIWSNSNCQTTDVDYGVTRTQYGSSVLTVKRNHRTKIAGSVRCGGTNGTVTYSPPCNVRVVYPAKQVNNCHAEVDTTDWTVSGSCDVNKIYASDGQYTCLWFHVPAVGQQTSLPQVSFILLTSFTDNGLEYQRRRCSFTGQIMPTTDGVHSYSLRINPGDSGGGNNLFPGQSIDIQHPSDPVLFNCPAFVIEGDDVTCSCQTSGSPPAVVTWTSGGRTDNSVLLLKNVSRSLDGHIYMCNQYWGGFSNNNWKTTTYTVQVHYPPQSPPQITGVQDGGHTEGEALTLSCSVTGGQPPVRSIHFWCAHAAGDSVDTTATVNGVTTLTSNVTFDRLNFTMNGTVCQCSAHWRERPSLYTPTSTATITVIAKSERGTTQRTTGPTTGTTSVRSTGRHNATNNRDYNTFNNNNINNNEDSAKLAALVGGTVGGVAVIIIFALIIVIVIIWKKRCDPAYAKPTSGGQDDTHTYTELTVYEQVGRQAPGVAQYENTAMQHEPEREQSQYENTDTEIPSSVDRKYKNTTTEKHPAPLGSHYENTVERRQEDVDGVKYENTSTTQRLDTDKAKYENTAFTL